jgi:predicted acylesterase/phospholipase RssA
VHSFFNYQLNILYHLLLRKANMLQSARSYHMSSIVKLLDVTRAQVGVATQVPGYSSDQPYSTSKDLLQLLKLFGRFIAYSWRSRALRRICSLVLGHFGFWVYRTISRAALPHYLSPAAKLELRTLRFVREQRQQARLSGGGDLPRRLSLARRLGSLGDDVPFNEENRGATNKTPLQHQKLHRLLCLDGGGVRGAITCVLLHRLQQHCPAFLDHVDLIAGTSTGGFVALALASCMTPQEALRVYQLTAPGIFSNSKRRVLFGANNILLAKFGNKGRNDAVKHIFGTARLHSLAKHVLIPTLGVDLANGECLPTVVTNMPPVKKGAGRGVVDNDGSIRRDSLNDIQTELVRAEEHENVLLSDLLTQTTSAPTFFPSHKGHVDGGVFANNPSLLALSKVCENGAVRPSDVVVLSLGTGDQEAAASSHSPDHGDVDWGLLQWAPHLIRVLMRANEKSANLACETMLGSQYHRLDFPCPARFNMDRVDLMDEMIAFAYAQDLAPTIAWLKRVWLPEKEVGDSNNDNRSKSSTAPALAPAPATAPAPASAPAQATPR